MCTSFWNGRDVKAGNITRYWSIPLSITCKHVFSLYGKTECLPQCQVSLFCSLTCLAKVEITLYSPFISQLNLNIIHCIMYQTSSDYEFMPEIQNIGWWRTCQNTKKQLFLSLLSINMNRHSSCLQWTYRTVTQQCYLFSSLLFLQHCPYLKLYSI